jgi:D-arabinose 1-dehydrogenase-like Zn-dependent alcohol dehydrogenase
MSERLRGKAVVFVRPLKAALHEGVGFPEMDDDGVVIKTAVSGISRGTELDLYNAEFHGRNQWYPMLAGYMPVGPAERVGKGVTHLREGDRAVASNLFSGFEDPYCCAWGGPSGKGRGQQAQPSFGRSPRRQGPGERLR